MTDHPVSTNPDVGFEKEDVNATSLIKFLLWLVVATVAIVFLLWRLYFVFVAQEAARQPPPPIMKPTAAQMAPLPPLLQEHPNRDLATFRAEEDALLRSYGWVDKELGRVHIPIEEAMRLVAEQGLPSFLPPTPPPPAPPAGKAPPAKTAGAK
jgi:hypothetical protein